MVHSKCMENGRKKNHARKIKCSLCGCDTRRRMLTVFYEQDVPDNELNDRIHLTYFADK